MLALQSGKLSSWIMPRRGLGKEDEGGCYLHQRGMVHGCMFFRTLSFGTREVSIKACMNQESADAEGRRVLTSLLQIPARAPRAGVAGFLD